EPPAERWRWRCADPAFNRPSGAHAVDDLRARAAETPLASAIGLEGLFERGLIEVRPPDDGEVKLRVGRLPEPEVADPLLAPGASEEIGLRRPGHRKMRCEVLFAEPVGFAGQLGRSLQQRPGGLEDVPAATVVR